MVDEITHTIDENTVLPVILKTVFELWNTLAKHPDLPLERDFSLEDIPSKLLPWSVLVDVQEDPLDFKFRFWGTERTNLIGAEMTGKFLSDITAGAMREGNRLEYEAVYNHPQAVICHTPIIQRSGLLSTRTSIRLPLSKDGTRVSRIFSAIDPDSITKDHYDYYGTVPRRGL